MEELKKMFTAFDKTDLVGIEINPPGLKLCRMKAGPKKEVLSLIYKDIKGLSDDDVSKAIAAGLREMGVTRSRVVLSIPSGTVISKNIEVPSTDSRELREIVNLQASRHTPFSREEIIVDYIDIGTFKQNYSRVLLLIVAASAVKKQVMIAEKAGVRIESILLAQEGIGIFAGKNVRVEEPSVPFGIIHVSDASTDFSVVCRNKVMFIRSIPIGSQQLLADKEKSRPKFLEEIKKSLEAYHAENIDKDPQGLFVAGAVEGMEDLDVMLESETRLPVKVFSYTAPLAITKEAAAGLTAAPGSSFLGVLGPLWALSETKVNLIPEETKLRRQLQERGVDMFTGAILLLAMLMLGVFISMSRIYFQSAYLKELETRYTSLSGDTRKLEKIFQENSLIRGYLTARGSSIKVLGELHDLAPANVAMAEIRFDREGKFTVKGTAESMSTVFAFVDSLERSKYFTDVKTKYAQKKQEGKRDLTEYEINAMVRTVTSD